MMWHDFFVALALVFVIEGIIPFLVPEQFRGMMLNMAQQSSQRLRTTGLISMICGIGLLYLIN